MKDVKRIDLKSAFGRTPESVNELIRRTLDEGLRKETEELIVKKKISTSLIAAILLLIVLAGVALAAGFGVRNLFSYTDEKGVEHSNEAASELAQQLTAKYEGEYVDFKLIDAINDSEGESFALSWSFTNKSPEDKLYVVCDGLTLEGNRVTTRSELYMTEFLLPAGETSGGATGDLSSYIWVDENGDEREGTFPKGSDDWQISFSVLKIEAKIVEMPSEFGYYDTDEDMQKIDEWLRNADEKGWLVMDGDGYLAMPIDYENVENANFSYSEALLETGKLSLADRFTLNFKFDESETKVYNYEGPEFISFEGCEVRIAEARITPTVARARFEVVTDTADGEWRIRIESPDGGTWTPNSGGRIAEPVKLADGRWMTEFNYNAMSLYTQPTELLMTLTKYDDEYNPVYISDPVTLKFV